MKRAILLVWAVSVFAVPAFAGDGNIRRSSDPIRGRYIAVLESQFPAAVHAEPLMKAAGVRPIHVYDAVLNGFAFIATEQAAAALSRNPLIKSVSEDGRAYGGITQYGVSPGLDRIDEIRAIYNDTQYTYSYAGYGVRVYIIDSGVNNVSDLAGRLVENINFVTDQWGWRNPNDFADCAGHGTPVATIAAGTTYGVAKSAEVANVRVLACNNSGSWADIIAGMNYVRQQKWNNPTRRMVANISIWGGVDGNADQAARDLANAGVAVALIAGNGNGDDANNHSPGRIGSTQLGAATTGAIVPSNDWVTGYSSQGSVIDIFAPGDTLAMDMFGGQTGFNGTSAAAPYVAGVMAKHWETYPTMTAQQLEDHILLNAQPGVQGRTLGSPDRALWSNSAKRRACCS